MTKKTYVWREGRENPLTSINRDTHKVGSPSKLAGRRIIPGIPLLEPGFDNGLPSTGVYRRSEGARSLEDVPQESTTFPEVGRRRSWSEFSDKPHNAHGGGHQQQRGSSSGFRGGLMGGGSPGQVQQQGYRPRYQQAGQDPPHPQQQQHGGGGGGGGGLARIARRKVKELKRIKEVKMVEGTKEIQKSETAGAEDKDMGQGPIRSYILVLELDLPEFFRDQHYDKDDESTLERIIVFLSANGQTAALTSGEYLRFMWPNTAEQMLSLLKRVTLSQAGVWQQGYSPPVQTLFGCSCHST